MKKINFSNALRCIGQDLLRRDLKTFDIRNEGDRYVVQGGYQAPPAATPVTIHYTLADIRELFAQAPEKRGGSAPSEDFVNLVQILRTIGGYLDKIEARLIRLTNSTSQGSGPLFRLEFETADGELKVEEHSSAVIYEMCVAMYKRRGRLTGTGDRFDRKRGR